MRVTIVMDDNLVLVEGQPETIDCSAWAARDVHAVQWYGSHGEIEYAADLDDGDRKPNEKIAELGVFQELVDAWMTKARTAAPVVDAGQNPPR